MLKNQPNVGPPYIAVRDATVPYRNIVNATAALSFWKLPIILCSLIISLQNLINGFLTNVSKTRIEITNIEKLIPAIKAKIPQDPDSSSPMIRSSCKIKMTKRAKMPVLTSFFWYLRMTCKC